MVIIFPKIRLKAQLSIVKLGTINRVRVINSYSVDAQLKKSEIENFFGNFLLYKGLDIKILDLKITSKSYNFQTITLIIETTEGCLFGEDFTFLINKYNLFNWNLILFETNLLSRKRLRIL